MHPTVGFLLEQRGGVVSRRELLASGLTKGSVDHAVASGSLVRLAPGVYGSECARNTVDRLRVALAQAGPGAVASHTTAAWLWGLSRTPASPDQLHVSVPRGQRLTSRPGVRWHERIGLERSDDGGIPMTSARDTLVTSAAILPARELRFPVMKAVQSGFVTPQQLAAAANVPRWSLRRWRLVVEEAAAGAWSGGEATYWRLLTQTTLPLPRLNVPIQTPHGLYVVDALWPEYGLGAEIDGRDFHAQGQAFERDRTKGNASLIKGLPLLRFSVARVLTQGPRVMQETSDALTVRAQELNVRLKRRPARRVESED